MMDDMKSRYHHASKLATVLAEMRSHMSSLQTHISKLTPLSLISKQLLMGKVSPTWFVQRLIDSGFSEADAEQEFLKLKHGPGGDAITQEYVKKTKRRLSPIMEKINGLEKQAKANGKGMDTISDSVTNSTNMENTPNENAIGNIPDSQ